MKKIRFSKILRNSVLSSLIGTQLFHFSPVKSLEVKDKAIQLFYQVEDFVVEKTNPFDYQSAFYDEDLLLEEYRDEAVQKVFYALILNNKIPYALKIKLGSLKEYLQDNSSINLEVLYNVFGKLKITVQDFDYASMQTVYTVVFDKNQSNGFSIQDNYEIQISCQNLEAVSKEKFHADFFHEGVHLTGGFLLYQNGHWQGDGLTEGMTAFICEDYNKDASSYFFLKTSVKMLVELLGKEKMMRYYSTYDLKGLKQELQLLGISFYEINELVENLDTVLFSTPEEIDKTIYQQILEFFKNCSIYLTEKNRTSYFYYFNTLKNYVEEKVLTKSLPFPF